MNAGDMKTFKQPNGLWRAQPANIMAHPYICGHGETEASALADAAGKLWLVELFEFELCAECGGDWDNHDCMGTPLGQHFAQCRVVPAPCCPDELRKQLESVQ